MAGVGASGLRVAAFADTSRAFRRQVAGHRTEAAAVLERRVAELVEHRGSVVLLVGEAGIGKSFLASAAQDLAASAGALAAHVVCLPVTDSLPLDPVRTLLDALGTQTRDHGADRERVAGAFFAGLEHCVASAPVLVVVDDVHLIGSSAAAIVESAAVRLSDLPVMWLFAGRPCARVSDLGRHLAKHRSVERVALEPLDDQGVASLLSQRLEHPVSAAIAAEVRARTGGNPLLCTAVADAELWDPEAASRARQPAPVLLADVVADWLEHLGRRRVEVVRSASVLPEPIRRDWLRAMPGGSPALGADLDALASDGLLELGSDGTSHFRHPLLREALYDSLGPEERVRRHAAAARAMAAAPSHLLAPQLAAAGRCAEAATAYVDTAAAIYEAGGGDDAYGPYERAEALARQAGDVRLLRRIRGGRALASLRAGRRDEADATMRALSAELRPSGDIDELVGSTTRYALALWDEASDLDAARAVLAEVWPYVDSVGSAAHHPPTPADAAPAVPARERTVAEAKLIHAVLLDRAGDPAGAIPYAEQALEAAQRLGDPDLGLRSRSRLGLMIGEAKSAIEGIAWLRGVATEAVNASMLHEAGLAYLNLSYLAEVAGDAEQMGSYAREGIVLQGVPASIEALLRGNLSYYLMNAGDLEGALAHSLAAWRVAARIDGSTADRITVGLVHIHVRRGEIELAGRLLDGLAFPPGSFEERRMLEAKGLLFEESNKLTDAAASYRSVADAPDHPGVPWCLAGLARCAAALGDLELAADAVTRLAATAMRWPASSWLHTLASAALAAAQGDSAAAVSAYDAAANETTEAFERARCRAESARLRRDAPGLAAAADLFDEMGARRAGDRVRQTARQLGLAVTRPRKSVGVLSSRELEVAHLVAAGRRNAEIADLLYISERTVERHVSNVLTKLGLRSRVELAALAAAGKLPGSGAAPPPASPPAAHR